MPFVDRADAGRRLAERLAPYRGEDVVVLGLARGGVAVAHEVAPALGAPLDVVVVRKLGVPYQTELGMGAVGEGGVVVLNRRIVELSGVDEDVVREAEARQRAEAERQAALYRGGRPPVPLIARTAVVVDDGMATGSTARAACQVARARGASKVVLAVPVASPESVTDLGRDYEVVCLEAPHRLWAVGQWYDDFRQASDEEVMRLLAGPEL